MTRSLWIAMFWIAALVLGFSMASVGFYFAAQWNGRMIISDVHAEPSISTIGKTRVLSVEFHLTGAQECPSWTQHTVYQDVSEPKRPGGPIDRMKRVVVPLGITVNGLGAPSDRTDFEVPFPLPSSVTPGAWSYTAITSMSCEWWPGWTRQHVQETDPIVVTVPEPAL